MHIARRVPEQALKHRLKNFCIQTFRLVTCLTATSLRLTPFPKREGRCEGTARSSRGRHEPSSNTLSIAPHLFAPRSRYRALAQRIGPIDCGKDYDFSLIDQDVFAVAHDIQRSTKPGGRPIGPRIERIERHANFTGNTVGTYKDTSIKCYRSFQSDGSWIVSAWKGVSTSARPRTLFLSSVSIRGNFTKAGAML